MGKRESDSFQGSQVLGNVNQIHFKVSQLWGNVNQIHFKVPQLWGNLKIISKMVKNRRSIYNIICSKQKIKIKMKKIKKK